MKQDIEELLKTFDDLDESYKNILKYCKRLLKEKLELKQTIDNCLEFVKEIIILGDEWHWDNSSIGDEVRELRNILENKKE